MMLKLRKGWLKINPRQYVPTEKNYEAESYRQTCRKY